MFEYDEKYSPMALIAKKPVLGLHYSYLTLHRPAMFRVNAIMRHGCNKVDALYTEEQSTLLEMPDSIWHFSGLFEMDT